MGLTSFGGPIAHIGYFRREFVEKRAWLDERSFAELVGLCQFLPGPASSQVGFAIGLMRAGPFGALAAWLGFTLPSALMMVAFAYGASFMPAAELGGITHGLKLAAVAVVAQAIVLMARTLTPDLQRIVIAAIACSIAIFAGAFVGQVAAIAFGAIAGFAVAPAARTADVTRLSLPISRRFGAAALLLFMALLAGAMVLPGDSALAKAAAFYRAGALVFGGGHVVLPLLQQGVVTPHWISQDAFLAGYGAAQALPGPLFSFAAYLGALMPGQSSGWLGALMALAAIFLPGMLALIAALPFWRQLSALGWAQRCMRGANAAVVGVLAAAFYNPVWTSAVRDLSDIIAAAFGFIVLTAWRAPPLVVVGLATTYGLVRMQFFS